MICINCYSPACLCSDTQHSYSKQVFYTESNFSMAFSYVAALEEAMENSLVSRFAEACGQDLGISNVAFSESCSVEGENFQKLANNVNEIEMFDD